MIAAPKRNIGTLVAAGEIIAPDWRAPEGVHAYTTTREIAGTSRPPFDTGNLGAHCGDDAAAVAANRAALANLLDLPEPPRWLRQVHGKGIAHFDATRSRIARDVEVVADAAITRMPGVVLAVLTADCVPILVCANDGSEVAAIHAGWRGLAAGVIERTIESMNAPRAQLLAWLGPAIGPASYEVGGEVRDAFLTHDVTAYAAFVPTRSQRWHCDLYALAQQRLAALGIARVCGGGFDTFVDSRFYSHRRSTLSQSGRTGRFASLIWIAEPVSKS